MSKNLTIILIVVLVVLILANLGLLAWLVVQLNKIKNRSANPSADQVPLSCSPTYNTDFFINSVALAEKVLQGDNSVKNGEKYSGTPLFDIISTLNDNTKKSVIIAIKSMSIEPVTARNIEKQFRYMAEQEKVPLWFIILREAVKKVVPTFMQFDKFEADNNLPVPGGKIISITKAA